MIYEVCITAIYFIQWHYWIYLISENTIQWPLKWDTPVEQNNGPFSDEGVFLEDDCGSNVVETVTVKLGFVTSSCNWLGTRFPWHGWNLAYEKDLNKDRSIAGQPIIEFAT